MRVSIQQLLALLSRECAITETLRLSKKQPYIINSLCFVSGGAFVVVAGWVLDMIMDPGPLKAALDWMIIGVVPLLFGGISASAKHR